MTRAKRAGQRSRTVREDWFAWIPNEMDQLFDATRHELESSNFILSVSLDEALSLCKGGQFDSAKERAIVIAGLFDRLAVRVGHVIRTIKDHGSHFGTLPNVKPLSPSNFRGVSAQGASHFTGLALQQLEVLGYDLNTCMGETDVILKSFFCALPPEELETFREKLVNLVPSHLSVDLGKVQSFDS